MKGSMVGVLDQGEERGGGRALLVLAGDLVEHRGNHFAGTAPLGPEVDEDRRVASDQFSECGILCFDC